MLRPVAFIQWGVTKGKGKGSDDKGLDLLESHTKIRPDFLRRYQNAKIS